MGRAARRGGLVVLALVAGALALPVADAGPLKPPEVIAQCGVSARPGFTARPAGCSDWFSLPSRTTVRLELRGVGGWADACVFSSTQGCVVSLSSANHVAVLKQSAPIALGRGSYALAVWGPSPDGVEHVGVPCPPVYGELPVDECAVSERIPTTYVGLKLTTYKLSAAVHRLG